MELLTHFFLHIVDKLGYPGLFLVMTLGNLGIPVGTELVVPAAGALAATGHLSSLWLAAFVATLGEVVGGTILYAIGYAGGEPFVARFGRYIKVDAKKLAVFHTFYERHGNATVFVCRFLPFVRGVAALPAGVSRMPKRYFIAYTAAGSAVFCFGLAYVGSLFGRHFDAIAPTIHRSSTLVIALLVVAVLGFLIFRIVRARRAARGQI
ncbi:MAG: DedA family protein [Candidatus Eremiobacteraeota bacterium]|nr:DedA family protein [Candidatus Eremiobacteraeota bacterium]